MTIKRNIVLLISLLSLGVGMALAQIKSSTITGAVTDQKGAVVAGANVTVTEMNKGVSKTIKTNAVGDYTVPYLDQGVYAVTVKAEGFQTFRKTDIPIATGATVSIDVQLTVGSVSQTVEVRASAAELQTETTTVQGTVDTNVIANIPNINDNPLYYATLQAGVVPSSEMYNNEALGVGFQDRQAMSGMNINGGEAGNGDVQIDGLSVQGAGWHESTQLPNRDALQEVAVTTNTLPADLGGGLGVVQLATKSGSNKFHGDLSYRMRNEQLNAMGTSLKINNPDKTRPDKYRLNEWSGAVGGPVLIPRLYNGRDKMFFFASFSRDSHPSVNTGYETIPTALQRTGDFSASSMRNAQDGNNPMPSTVFDPWSGTPYGSGGNTYQRNEFPTGPNGPGDIVDTPDPAGLVVMSMWPNPNHTPDNAFQDNNFKWSGGTTTIRDNFSARLDFHFIPNHSIYVTGGFQNGTQTAINEWYSGDPPQQGYTAPITALTGGGWGQAFTDQNYFGSIGDTITVSPTTIVDIRYGVNRVHAMAGKPDVGAPFTAADYEHWGMPSAVQDYISVPGAPPTIGKLGGDLAWENWDIWERKNEHQTNHTVTGSVTKLLGKWTLKEGAEYRVYLSNWVDLRSGTPMLEPGDHNDSAIEEFGTASGGNSSQNTTSLMGGDQTATVLVGAQGWTLGPGADSHPALAAKYLAFYSQNDWKITPKLTVNLGVRYEVQPGPTERHNQIGDYDLHAKNPYDNDPNGGRFVFAGDPGYSRNLWDYQWNNVGPRIGAAYQLDNSTVLRLGYGRIYAPSNTGYNANTSIYGTSGFAGGTNATPFGIGSPYIGCSTCGGFNGLPVGAAHAGIEDPKSTQILPAKGAVQAPGIYGGFGDAGFFTRNHKNQFMDEWNVTLERRFRGWIASAAYVGSKGTHLVWRDEALNGQFNVPWTTLRDWQHTWQATNGATNLGQTKNIPNPLPGLIGGAQGDSGSGSITGIDSLEPYKAWLGGYWVGDNATSLYHSLQLKAQHSYSSGLSAQFTYTYSRSTGLTGGQTSSNGNGSTFAQSQLSTGATPLGGTDYRSINNNNSLLNFDTPNRFVGVVSYLLPTGKGKLLDPGNTLARAVIGEWNIAAVVTVQEGMPWGPNCGSENGRCIATGQPLKLPKSQQIWYNGSTSATLPDGRTFTPNPHHKLMWNPDAFTGQIVRWSDGSYHQAQYWEGNTKQAMPELRLPYFQNVNLSVSRKFPIREGMSFEILAEATNAFNHSNYQPSTVNNNFGSLVTIPNSDPAVNSKLGENTNSDAGSVGLNFIDPRQMTLSARFNF
jgi:hypothetical protein